MLRAMLNTYIFNRNLIALKVEKEGVGIWETVAMDAWKRKVQCGEPVCHTVNWDAVMSETKQKEL